MAIKLLYRRELEEMVDAVARDRLGGLSEEDDTL
jgi:hypothetical protein